MAINVKNSNEMYKHFPFQGASEFTQIGIFWYENIPSGNPEPHISVQDKKNRLYPDWKSLESKSKSYDRCIYNGSNYK
jgi:hypothetical protein